MAYKFWPARCVQKKKCKENILALGILCFLFIKLWKREKVGIAMFQRDMRHYSVELITLSNTTLSNLLIKTSRKGEIITKGRCQNLKWAACLCCSALFISRGSSKHPSSNGKVFIWSECIWPYLGQPLSIFFFLQSTTFISQAVVTGFVKTIIFTWFMGSVSLTGRGLTFLSETFPNNYTFPERVPDIESLKPWENYNCIRTLEVEMRIFTQQSKKDLSGSHHGHTGHCAFYYSSGRQHLLWILTSQRWSPKLSTWSVALYPGSCFQLLSLVPDFGANHCFVVLYSPPVWMSHVPQLGDVYHQFLWPAQSLCMSWDSLHSCKN